MASSSSVHLGEGKRHRPQATTLLGFTYLSRDHLGEAPSASSSYVWALHMGPRGPRRPCSGGVGHWGIWLSLCPVFSLDAIANLLSSNTSRQDVCPKPRETRSSSEDSLITLSSPCAALRSLSAVSADRALPRSQATDRHSQEGPGWLRPLGLRRAGEAGRWFSLHVVYQNVLLLGSISPVRTL